MFSLHFYSYTILSDSLFHLQRVNAVSDHIGFVKI
jgi:hypothetical protein